MNKRVLVIEGDDQKQALINNYLSDLKFVPEAITHVHGPEDALNLANKEFSIILADLPPSLNTGMQHLRMLQNHFTEIPLVVLTENYDADACASAIRGGAQDFVTFGSLNAPYLEKIILCAIERKSLLVRSENASVEYEKHFNNGPMPMWIVDGTSMKFLLVNNATVKRYGYSREEFRKMTPRDIRPEEDVEAIVKFFYEKKDGYYDAGYWRHKTKNGEIFYVHVYSHVISYNGIDARLSIIVDVNEKHLADMRNKELMDMIQEQKEELDSILYSVSDAIWSRRAGTMELIYANNAYYKLYDYSPGEPIMGKPLETESIHPADRAALSLAMHEVQTAGKTEVIYRYLHRNGNTKILKVNAAFKKGSGGKPDLITGVTIDITQEKELYDTIRNSEQKLRATINNTKDLIWSVNSKLELIFCNKPYQDFFYKVTGMVLDEGDFVLGNWHDEAFISKRTADYRKAFDGESFSTVVEEYVNGDSLYFEIGSNPIYDVDGKIIGVNCISRDITDQKKQLIQIQQQNEQLKEIAWIQSHKVRGPVASILGLVELFDKDQPGSDQNLEVLDLLTVATIDLDSIIKGIVKITNEIEYNETHPGELKPIS